MMFCVKLTAGDIVSLSDSVKEIELLECVDSDFVFDVYFGGSSVMIYPHPGQLHDSRFRIS